MNYIYDVILNLNRNSLYDFYEWKEEDNPEFILKIPVFKVDEETFLNFKYDNIILDKKTLNLIENKTETYSPNCIGIIRYASLFVFEESVLAIEFDSDGNNYMKSVLSIDEENEIIDSVANIKYSLIDYKVKKQSKRQNNFITRKEYENKEYIIKKINNMKKNNEYSKLKYIFYELYDEKKDDVEKIYEKLINVTKNSDYKFKKLSEILNLMENKKIMSNNS